MHLMLNRHTFTSHIIKLGIWIEPETKQNKTIQNKTKQQTSKQTTPFPYASYKT